MIKYTQANNLIDKKMKSLKLLKFLTMGDLEQILNDKKGIYKHLYELCSKTDNTKMMEYYEDCMSKVDKMLKILLV